MTRTTTIALGAGVLVLVGAGAYLVWKRRRSANPTQSMAGGVVPTYVPGGYDPFNPQGPPLPASNKVGKTGQDISSTVQQGVDVLNKATAAFDTGKKAWSDVKDFFS